MTVWVRDLLGLWSSRDTIAAAQNMGYPSTSFGFGLACEDADESEDATGYSSSELSTMGDATIWLAGAYPDHWRALSREYRPWTRRTLAPKPGDAQLVERALVMLGEYIDKSLG